MFIHTLMHLVSQVLLQALIIVFVLGFKYVLKAFDPDSRSVYDLSIEEVVLFTRRLRLLSNPHRVSFLHTLLLIEVLACHTVRPISEGSQRHGRVHHRISPSTAASKVHGLVELSYLSR